MCSGPVALHIRVLIIIIIIYYKIVYEVQI